MAQTLHSNDTPNSQRALSAKKDKDWKDHIPAEILNDLSSRFIINVPYDEKNDSIRVCFQIEQAHWFYLDFYVGKKELKLKSFTMTEFAFLMFNHIEYYQPYIPQLNTILEEWRTYKLNVPTFGAIILNKDLTKVVLVQSYFARSSWSFPKGKRNEDEAPKDSAIREVFEETGFDITEFVNDNEFIETNVNDQQVRLYIVPGIKEDTNFEPKTRREIRAIEWFELDDLPICKSDMTPKEKLGLGPNAFYMIFPFLNKLKHWIAEKKGPQSAKNKWNSCAKSESSKVRRSERKQRSINKASENHKKLTTSQPQVTESKGVTPKGAIKRNLFGDINSDQSPALAKHLEDNGSPLKPITKGNMKNRMDNGNRINVEENKDNTSKTKKNKKGVIAKQGATDCKVKENKNNLSIFNFQTQLWADFKFDKKPILNCLVD